MSTASRVSTPFLPHVSLESPQCAEARVDILQHLDCSPVALDLLAPTLIVFWDGIVEMHAAEKRVRVPRRVVSPRLDLS
jgi:hypothetical protein